MFALIILKNNYNRETNINVKVNTMITPVDNKKNRKNKYTAD